MCVNAKATMQTYPCGHQVVCRKCFVKTIQMAVAQRLLPLRCVICRAKILRLKHSTGTVQPLPASASQYTIGHHWYNVPQSASLYSVTSNNSATSGKWIKALRWNEIMKSSHLVWVFHSYLINYLVGFFVNHLFISQALPLQVLRVPPHTELVLPHSLQVLSGNLSPLVTINMDTGHSERDLHHHLVVHIHLQPITDPHSQWQWLKKIIE